MLATDVIPATHEALVALEREARYPELIPALRPHTPGVLYYKQRPENGLITLVVQHGALTREQRRALGRFTLRQLLITGQFSLKTVERQGLLSDPELDLMSRGDTHAISGTADGVLLGLLVTQNARFDARGPIGPGHSLIRDPVRAEFPLERELFGTGVLASVPGLRDMPIERVREFSLMLRNQVHPGPLSVLGLTATTVAMAEVQVSERHGFDAVVSCCVQQTSTLLDRLGYPCLFAPFARQDMKQLPEVWDKDAAQGSYWPCAIATADLKRAPTHFDSLDTILDQPVREAWRRLVRDTKQVPKLAPREFLPAEGWYTYPEAEQLGREMPRRHGGVE